MTYPWSLIAVTRIVYLFVAEILENNGILKHYDAILHTSKEVLRQFPPNGLEKLNYFKPNLCVCYFIFYRKT